MDDPRSHASAPETHPELSAEVEALRREVERLQVLASRDRGLLATLLHHSPHGVIVCDAQGRFTLLNRAAERIWGGSVSAAEVADWARYRAFHPDGRPFAAEDWSMARCLASGAVVAAEEVTFERFDGSRGVLLGSCAPIFGPSGALEGALSVFADITAFKTVELAEREARVRLTRLQAVTTALCEAALPVEVARVVADEMRAVLGAEQAVMAVPSEDGAELVLLGHAGLPSAVPLQFARFPIDCDLPLAQSFRDGTPVWIASRADFRARFPGAPPVAGERAEGGACLPIRVHGKVRGAIGFAFSTPREFDAAERALLDNLASNAGLALERARLYESERRARREADVAKADAELLFRLAEATASVADLAALNELALDSVIRLLRVDRAAILLTGSDGVMRFEASRGLSEAYQRAVEGHSPWPADETEARPILIPDVARDDSVAAYRPVFAAEGVAAIGFVPLVHRRRLLGKLMVYGDAPRAFSRHDEGLAVTVAAHIAQAVDRARLLTAERAARDRTAFLLEASDVLASTLDFRSALDRLARLAVPRIADWCVVDIRHGPPDAPALPIVHHGDPRRVAQAQELRRRFPPGAAHRPNADVVIDGGQPVLIERMTDAILGAAAHDGEHLAGLRDLGIVSALAVPMAARGTTFGALIFATAESGRRFGPADLELADLLGRRAGIAIDNARLYAAESRARAEAERLAAEALAASRAREDVLAVVSHDLRNPLNAIAISASTLLRIEADDARRGPRVRKSAEVIHRSAERMTRLIGDLIDFASIQAGRLSIERGPASARGIVGAALELFASTAHERELLLSADVSDEFPPLDCDRDRVIQALSNLLGNAVKVTASGGRIVVSAATRGGEIVFCVEDTGPGIPPEDLPRIFDRYWRGRSAGYRGTGLGLAIARGIVEAHGGRMWAESAVGVGSRFFFALPATRPPTPGRGP